MELSNALLAGRQHLKIEASCNHIYIYMYVYVTRSNTRSRRLPNTPRWKRCSKSQPLERATATPKAPTSSGVRILLVVSSMKSGHQSNPRTIKKISYKPYRGHGVLPPSRKSEAQRRKRIRRSPVSVSISSPSTG